MQKVKLFFENIKSYIANNKTKSITILTVLILTIISSITLIAYSFYQNKSTQLIISGVALIDSSDVSIKVYRENKNDSGVGIGTYALSYYVPSSSSYTYQSSKTECDTGITITKYENQKFYVDATKKGKCKVYFDAIDGYIDDYEVNLFVQKEAGNTDDKNYNKMGQLPLYETGYYYTINTSKTSCTNGATVSIEGRNVVVLTTQKAVCNVYVDKSVDNVAPTITNLSNNSGSITAKLNDDVSLSGYAISNSNTEAPTEWNAISSTSYSLSTNVEKSGTFYLWVKDGANNVSVSNSFTVSFTPFSSIVVSKSSDLTSSQDGTVYNINNENGIRYTGHNPDNFVCFDDNSSGSCDEDNLYRIIGKFSVSTNINAVGNASVIKLIKYVPSFDYMQTSDFNQTASCSANTFNIDCNYLLNKLNNTFYNSLDSKYSNLILDTVWRITNISSSFVDSLTFNQYYQAEQNATATLFLKMGLPYISDYGYSFSSNDVDRTVAVNSIDFGKIDFSWMYNDYAVDFGLIWTMDLDNTSPYIIYKPGIAGAINMYQGGVFPTFHIQANTQVKSGNGSQSSPYRLAV